MVITYKGQKVLFIFTILVSGPTFLPAACVILTFSPFQEGSE